MKKILPAAALLLVLTVSCNRFRTQVYEDFLVMPLAAESPDSLHLSISLEYVTGGVSPEAMEAINGAISTQAFDLEEMAGTLEESAVSYRENLIDLYLNENEGQEGLATWEDEVDGLFMPDWKGKKNYTLSYYSFRGGAHGIMTVSYLVFNPSTGALLTEKDLFREGYEEPVAQVLKQHIADSLQGEEGLEEMVNLEAVAPNGNFYLDADGVTWVYQPYEIGPYALGILSATASWEELKPYLKQP